jgi:hypothetical protein
MLNQADSIKCFGVRTIQSMVFYNTYSETKMRKSVVVEQEGVDQKGVNSSKQPRGWYDR